MRADEPIACFILSIFIKTPPVAPGMGLYLGNKNQLSSRIQLSVHQKLVYWTLVQYEAMRYDLEPHYSVCPTCFIWSAWAITRREVSCPGNDFCPILNKLLNHPRFAHLIRVSNLAWRKTPILLDCYPKEFSQLAQIFRIVRISDSDISLAKTQRRQVWRRVFFLKPLRLCAFAPLREIFRRWVAALPR